MQSGMEFLKTQLDGAVAHHSALLQSMIDHESDADDERFRDLCTRHIPRMREHHRMLEEFRALLSGGPAGASAQLVGVVRQVAGSALAVARSLADAPQSDYAMLVGDLTLVRQLEVTFKTFRDGGRQLGIASLAQIGDISERHHDEYSAEAKRLLQAMFVERAQGAAAVVSAVADSRAHSRG